ncbi:helix-turn-helix domain-containing protein [Streptomyces sp. NPDC002431]
MSHHAFCGLSRKHLGALVEELAPRWEARCESARHQRREGARQRQAGAGPKHEFVFTDRLLATLVHLRTGLTHEALGVLYEVGSSTIGRALAEIRPLLAERGFAVPDPSLCPAEETEDRERPGRAAAYRALRLARAQAPSVLPADLRRARECRSTPVAPTPAIHRPPRNLRGNPPGHRRPRLRSRCPAAHPAQDEYRTRARPHDGLLKHPPANSPGQHAS